MIMGQLLSDDWGIDPARLRERLQGGGPIVVLMGGESSEREISLQSGRAVFECLQGAGFEVQTLDATGNFIATLQQLKPCFVFIALHGGVGENGVVQGLLELLGVPYSGSGVQASALAMNKLITKRIWRDAGLPTPEFAELNAIGDCSAAMKQLGGPLFVKPSSDGSSFGMSIARSESELRKAYDLASQYGSNVIAERLLEGPEFTVGIVNGRPLPSIRIETKRAFYDYEAKYRDSDTQFLIPSGLSAQDEEALQKLALEAFNILHCRGWGRVDIMRDGECGQFNLLEVNTVPGLTSHSLVPMAMCAAGLSLFDLIAGIIQGAMNEVRQGEVR